jgi:16S rRNA (guanine1516-N2)-methyltransferase
VTVSAGLDSARTDRARAKANAWGAEFVERPRKTGLDKLGGGPFLVLGARGWTFHDGDTELRFTPGMAMLRIKRLGKEEDTLLRLAQFKAGDSVLDCTFGLGADALVCARAVGPAGRVHGVEASFVLWALASEGLPELRLEGLAPISVQWADHLEVLRAAAAKSFDVVFFDPMFGRPGLGSPAFEVLRAHADLRPLAPEALAEARRVARRWVLIKGSKYSRDLKALGLKAEPGPRNQKRIWARVDPS